VVEIVNLNRFRKARRRDEAKEAAAANRVRSGRSKAEREAARRTAEKAREELDGKRLD
jgi:hypothetical protein